MYRFDLGLNGNFDVNRAVLPKLEPDGHFKSIGGVRVNFTYLDTSLTS